MKVSELIGKIHIAYKGKDASLAPTPGDAKYSMYLSRANDNQDRWAEDPAVDNPDLFGGDVTVALTDGFANLSADTARVTDPVMYGKVEIPIVSYKDRHRLNAGAYVVGPKGSRKLYVINPDSYPDNSFTVGVLKYPDSLVNQTDDVACTIPRWLILQTAAQLAEQDPAKEDLAPSLYNQATSEYSDGLSRTRKQMRGTSKKIAAPRYPRIGGL